MDFHELEAFLALANTQHFARAAMQVHLSPSALSRLLARLEEEVGVTLFARDTRQVALTPEGETFRAFAEESLHRHADLLLRLGERDDRLRGILRIYASVTACYSVLPPFVAALKTQHPDLRLSVQTGDPSDAASSVREGRAELALDALPTEGFSDLDSYSVRKTPLVFVASTDGAYGNLGLSSEIGPTNANLTEVLSSVPLILPKAGIARERFEKWARANSIKPDINAETAGNEAVLALARLGLGLGLVPRIVLDNSPFAEGLMVYNAGPDFGEYDIGFVQKPVASGSETARRLRSAIAEIIGKTYTATS